jgi:hypothetical protein
MNSSGYIDKFNIFWFNIGMMKLFGGRETGDRGETSVAAMALCALGVVIGSAVLAEAYTGGAVSDGIESFMDGGPAESGTLGNLNSAETFPSVTFEA